MLLFGCNEKSPVQNEKTVPHEGRWGIYALDLSTQNVTLIYSTSKQIYTSALRLNSTGNTFVFAQEIDDTGDTSLRFVQLELTEKIFQELLTIIIGIYTRPGLLMVQ